MNGALIRELNILDSGDMAPNDPMQKQYETVKKEYQTVVTNWKAINSKDLVEFNKLLTKYNIKSIALPPNPKT